MLSNLSNMAFLINTAVMRKETPEKKRNLMLYKTPLFKEETFRKLCTTYYVHSSTEIPHYTLTTALPPCVVLPQIIF